MKAKKWIDKKQCYVDCEISDNCSIYEKDMNKEVDAVVVVKK